MSDDDGRRRLHVLCLHGWGLSGQFTKNQIDNSVFSEREILAHVTYSYIDGFHDPQSAPTPFQEQLAKDAGLTGIHGNISRSHNPVGFKQWWTPEEERDDSSRAMSGAIKRVIGFLAKASRSQPVDGILGFSQGGRLCHELARLLSWARTRPLWGLGHPPHGLSWADLRTLRQSLRFVITVSTSLQPPIPPRSSEEEGQSDSNESTATVQWPERLVLPSLHMRQRQDPLVVCQDNALMAAEYDKPVVIENATGGHEIPRSELVVPSAKSEISRFIAQQVIAPSPGRTVAAEKQLRILALHTLGGRIENDVEGVLRSTLSWGSSAHQLKSVEFECVSGEDVQGTSDWLRRAEDAVRASPAPFDGFLAVGPEGEEVLEALLDLLSDESTPSGGAAEADLACRSRFETEESTPRAEDDAGAPADALAALRKSAKFAVLLFVLRESGLRHELMLLKRGAPDEDGMSPVQRCTRVTVPSDTPEKSAPAVQEFFQERLRDKARTRWEQQIALGGSNFCV